MANSSRIYMVAAFAFAGLLILLAGWWGIRKIDPTSGAEFVSDSPDGKYRFAVFCHDTIGHGHPEYEAGFFEGRWPHRELTGPRAAWNYDSVSSSDYRVAWHADGVDMNFKTGYGDNRAAISGRIVGGTQKWAGP